MYTIWLNNCLGWAGVVSWTELSSLSSGFSWDGLKNLAHDQPTNFTVRVEMDRAFREVNPHGLLRDRLGCMD